MQNAFSKYQPGEILQIIRANYIQQQQYDDIALKKYDLTFDTSIFEWRDICDLVDNSKLWKYLNYYFRMEVEREKWLTVLEPDDRKTLADLCNFISENAEKEAIKPITLLGKSCNTAAIFKALKSRLENRGMDVSDFKPSSKFEPLVKKYRSIIIEEINQLAPTVLPPVNYKTNWVYKWGLRSLLIFLFVTFYLAHKESNWAWATGTACLVGFSMTWIGARLNPKQASFENIGSVADLIRMIDRQAPTNSR